MAQFIGSSMARGFAGSLTRGAYDNTVEARQNDASAPVAAFGLPLKLKGSAVTPAGGADAGSVIGFSVREYKQADMAGAVSLPFVSVLRRGYLAVSAAGTPAAGGKVYLDSKGKITAAATNDAIPGAVFMGSADADGLAEIAFNI